MPKRKEYNKFTPDASVESENRLRQFMELGGAKCLIAHNGDFRFDQRYRFADGSVLDVELKDETKQAHTGNLFFEMTQGFSNAPSGLAKTQAQVEVHELPQSYEVFNVERLRDYIADCMKFPWVQRNCGDNNNNGVLRPMAIMRGYEFYETVQKVQVAAAVRRMASVA